MDPNYDILSEAGSANFKRLIATFTNLIPRSNKPADMDVVINVLSKKKADFKKQLESGSLSSQQKEIIQPYYEEIERVLAMAQDRKNMLNNNVGGRRKSKRRKSVKKRKSMRKKSVKKRKSMRRKHH